MADNPDTRPGEVAVAIPVNDVPHAPFIFYDGAPVSGYLNGVISLTLSANRTCIGPDGVPRNEHVVVAYLRGNIQAAVNLRKAECRFRRVLSAGPDGPKEGTTKS